MCGILGTSSKEAKNYCTATFFDKVWKEFDESMKFTNFVDSFNREK